MMKQEERKTEITMEMMGKTAIPAKTSTLPPSGQAIATDTIKWREEWSPAEIATL